jgi:hypothetical protein
MIQDSLRAARLALGYWPLTLSALVIYTLFGLAILTEPLLDSGAIAGLMIPCLIGLVIINYLMSRRAGAPHPNEIGSVGRWCGWGFLSGVPAIAILLSYAAVIGFEKWSNSEQPLWIESILFAFGSAVAMPLTALSTGRAINGEGPSASHIFAYCKQNFGPIFLSGFALLLILNLFSDGFLEGFGMKSLSPPLSVFFGIAGGLALLAIALATIGLSATIYRNAEKMADPSATS